MQNQGLNLTSVLNDTSVVSSKGHNGVGAVYIYIALGLTVTMIIIIVLIITLTILCGKRTTQNFRPVNIEELEAGNNDDNDEDAEIELFEQAGPDRQ